MTKTADTRIALLVRNDLKRDNRLQKEARALRDAGYQVWCVGIVTSSGQALHEETDYGTVVRVLTTPKLRSHGDGPSVRTELTAAESASVYGGVLGSVRHYLGRVRENRKLENALREIAPDLVICHDPDSSFAGVAWSRATGKPLAYDAREVWTEQNPEAHWLYKWLWSRAEKRVMRHAAFSMTVNDPIARELERRYGVNGVATVYNGSSECLDHEPVLHDPIRLFFQGSFAPDRNLITLVKSMKYVGDQAVLFLQGYGEMEHELKQTVELEGLDDVVFFVPACAPSEVVRCASEYDVGVICHLPTSLNHELAAPNKLFDYMAGGLAVAGSDLPVIRQIVRDTGCGSTISPSTPETLAQGLIAIVQDPGRLLEMKRAASKACEAYSWKNQALKELALIRRAFGDAE